MKPGHRPKQRSWLGSIVQPVRCSLPAGKGVHSGVSMQQGVRPCFLADSQNNMHRYRNRQRQRYPRHPLGQIEACVGIESNVSVQDLILTVSPLIMENQMEKKMENEMETREYMG